MRSKQLDREGSKSTSSCASGRGMRGECCEERVRMSSGAEEWWHAHRAEVIGLDRGFWLEPAPHPLSNPQAGVTPGLSESINPSICHSASRPRGPQGNTPSLVGVSGRHWVTSCPSARSQPRWAHEHGRPGRRAPARGQPLGAQGNGATVRLEST